LPGFKRRQLVGSEELFRATGREDTAAADGGDLSQDELRWLIEGLQGLRYPERARPRLTISQFEDLARLQETLRGYLEEM
jgi:hypothetical protein